MEVFLTLIGLMVVWWVLSSLHKQDRVRQVERQFSNEQKMAAELTEAACRFVDQANDARAFPEISPGNVNIQTGEFALLRESSTLFEQKTRRISSGVGTRVKIGKMPFYLGSGSSSSYEVTEPTADGELVLTNRRVIFLAPQRSATIALKDVIGIDATLECIIFHSSKRKNPHVFTVRNSALWSLLSKIVSSHPLESRLIPDGVTLNASATGEPGHVEFEATLGPRPVKII